MRNLIASPARLAAGVLIVAVVVAGTAAFTRHGETVISGEVVDARSKEPVAGARIAFGDRIAFLFRSSAFRLHPAHFAPDTLTVSAPGYLERTVRVDTLPRQPLRIALEAVEIPGLSSLVAWPQWNERELVLDVQLRNARGTIDRYPSIDLPGKIVVTENLGDASLPVRGAVLFDETIPEERRPPGSATQLRYRIPLSAFRRPSTGTGALMLDIGIETAGRTVSWSRADIDADPLLSGEH